MHLKRQKAPKSWSVPRKGNKYLAMPSHNQVNSISLIMSLREILNGISTRKELKKVLNEGKIKINGAVVKKINYSLGLFDVLSFENGDYRVSLNEHRKFIIEPIDPKDANSKISKVIGKKILNNKKMQVNLSDGRNYLSNEEIKTGDSVLINLKENKISKILPLKIKSRVFITKGKHAGQKGAIAEIVDSGKKKIARLDNKINVQLENLIVII